MKKFTLFIFLVSSIVSCFCESKRIEKKEKIKIQIEKKNTKKNKVLSEDPKVILNDKNVINFLYEFNKQNNYNKVKISTSFGEIIIRLFDETPYHKSNFIYLSKLGYFNNTFFHRVVPNFIIQGGNSDRKETSIKRRLIGKYLLPVDAKSNIKHKRGIVSMPSSDINNPYKLASPYEFFIVQKKNGAYHLDGNYTPFGRVIKGMNVVDKINSQPIDNREAPINNIKMRVEIIE
ncbi:MAG: peptidylprolyl isomerase [Flavobacteriaceae bacterium]|tara:strand:+ start:17185 stop:17883 length:699 start_codon:yes stop_codon:yes gene_type:complete